MAATECLASEGVYMQYSAMASFNSVAVIGAAETPETIGHAVWLALTNARPKVCTAIVPQRFKNWTIPQLIPMRMLDKLVAQFFGIKARNR